VKRSGLIRTFFAALIAAAAMQPNLLSACAACFGQSNDKMADGMNWGIFTLLVVVVGVLGGVATFFVCLARKAGTVTANEIAESWPAPNTEQKS
jgi:heme/copper-type cytochrome/quinol oxidase subunit 2